MSRDAKMTHHNTILDGLIKLDCMIRLHFYDGIGLEDIIWTGKVVLAEIDKETGYGYLSFSHMETEAKRLQCDRSYLFFPENKILSIDVLSKDFDELSAFECPHCGMAIALESTVTKPLPEEINIDEEEEASEECLGSKSPLAVV
jgi:hypothetical protein